jgi:hypothetical protein
VKLSWWSNSPSNKKANKALTKGKESNWLHTDPERRFFLLARFYGPDSALPNRSFELNDIERVK